MGVGAGGGRDWTAKSTSLLEKNLGVGCSEAPGGELGGAHLPGKVWGAGDDVLELREVDGSIPVYVRFFQDLGVGWGFR